MARITVHQQAEDDVDEIAAIIAKDNLSAALRFYDRVQEAYDRIAAWPLIGTVRRSKSRELDQLRSYPIRGYRNYLVFYRATSDAVEVLHVIHGARDV